MYGYGYSLYNRTPFLGTSGVDPAAQAYFAATGITGVTQQAAINNLVKGLKTDGIWSKMKAVYPFVTDNRNLLGYTEDFINGYWNKTGGSAIVSNTTIAPNGTTTADTFITASGSMTNRMISSTLDIIGQTVCVSIYAKSDTFNRIKLTNNASNVISADFNLDAGTLIGTTGSVISTSISSVGNGWYRCSMSYVATDATVLYRMPLITSGISSSIFVWGAQLELGSTATTYQPIATTQQAFIASQFKYNLVNPVDSDAAFRLVFNGGWTHSSNGATPNGTNGYADTKLVPSSVFLNNNNGNFGYYHRTILKNLSASIGAETPYFMDYVTSTGTSVVPSINDPNSVAITITKNAGFRQASRDASNVNNINYRYNDTNYVKTEASTGRTTNAIRIGSSTGLYYSDTQFAFVYFGDTQLTQSEQSNLYTRVQAYQTALSRQV
jgi:hypothetical protein